MINNLLKILRSKLLILLMMSFPAALLGMYDYDDEIVPSYYDEELADSEIQPSIDETTEELQNSAVIAEASTASEKNAEDDAEKLKNSAEKAENSTTENSEVSVKQADSNDSLEENVADESKIDQAKISLGNDSEKPVNSEDNVEKPEAQSKQSKMEAIKAKFRSTVDGIKKSKVYNHKYFWPGAIAAGTLVGVGGTAGLVYYLRSKKTTSLNLATGDWNGAFVEKAAGDKDVYELTDQNANLVYERADETDKTRELFDRLRRPIICGYREDQKLGSPSFLKIIQVNDINMISLKSDKSGNLDIYRGPGNGASVMCFVNDPDNLLRLFSNGIMTVRYRQADVPSCGKFFVLPNPILNPSNSAELFINEFFLDYTIFLFKQVLNTPNNTNFSSHVVFLTLPHLGDYPKQSHVNVVNYACWAICSLFNSKFNGLAALGFTFRNAPPDVLNMTVAQFFKLHNIKTYVLLPNDQDLLNKCRIEDRDRPVGDDPAYIVDLEQFAQHFDTL